MPINNVKGLEALRALSEGGSASLNAYKAAQGNEAQSRTGALQKALGTQDVGAAVAEAQAKYSPKVPTSGLGVGDLSTAANSYLTQSANKLAAQTYEDQENLKLQTETLARNSVSEKDRQLMLQGAADVMGQQQQGALEGQAGIGNELGQLGQQKAALRNQLTQIDQLSQGTPQATTPVYGDTQQAQNLQALIANSERTGGNEAQRAEYVRMLNELRAAPGNGRQVTGQEANTMAGSDAGLLGTAARAQAEANPGQRDEILRQMAGLDQQYADKAGQYAGFLGTDAKGLMDRYAQADTGNVDAVRSFLGEEGMKGMASGALGERTRGIEMGTQQRMRELAPAFGINELKAAGMFREGEGTDLKQQNALANEKDYVAGNQTPKQETEAYASDLGFPSVEDYKSVRSQTKMSNEDISEAVQTPAWAGVQNVFDRFVNEGGDADDFKGRLREYVASLPRPEGTSDEAWDKSTARLITMAEAYYKKPVAAVKED